MIVRFLSLAALSQVALIAQQLILLPLQIHVWGHDVVAIWLAALAGSAILGAADLGLRNVGFSHVARNDAGPAFNTVWTICRLHMLVGMMIVAVVIVAQFGARVDEGRAWYLVLLALSYALDSLFASRTAILEARGHIARCESLFLMLAVSRLVIGGGAIALFRAGPEVLSVAWLATSVLVLGLQSRLKDAGQYVPLSGRWSLDNVGDAYRQSFWSAATPFSAWAQLQFPVMALALMAPAPTVSAFVAIRSVFSLVRAIITQVSRIASVKYVELAAIEGEARPRTMLILAAGATACGVAAIAFAVFAEHQMILGPIFDLPRGDFVNILTLLLAIAAIFSVHQIFAVTLIRKGQLTRGGFASYVNCAAMALTGAIAVASSNPLVLVSGLAVCDALFFAQVVWPFLAKAPSSNVGRGSQDDAVPDLAGSLFACLAGLVVLTAAGWAFFDLVFYREGLPAGLDVARLATATVFAMVLSLVAAAFCAALGWRHFRAVTAPG